jgi:protein SCO1/2
MFKLFKPSTVIAATVSICSMLVCAHASADHHDHGAMSHDHAEMNHADQHAEHRHMVTDMQTITRTTGQYTVPMVSVLREDGKQTDFASELDDGRVVVLNFMYTTCTEICPLTTKIFADFQKKLGAKRNKVHLVSISVDPEQDRPEVLQAYAKKYGVKTGWNFYTGTVEDSGDIQKAFGVYRGDKMNHTPATFLRAAPGKLWLRLDGFASADELLRSYRELVGVSATTSK